MSIIIDVTRGDGIESRHIAYGVVVDENGDIVYSTGDSNYLTCIRSSLKPFQAAASVQAGAVKAAGFSEQELALMCASHFGEDIHIKTAKTMMKKLELSSKYYECGSHYPYNKDARLELYSKNKSAQPWHNNCSGKHAGMLACAKHLNASLNGYVSPNHPVQQCILNYVSDLTDNKNFSIAIDGCSAPTPFLPLSSLASLFQKLAASDRPELKKVYTVMTKYPYIIAGKNRFDTDFMKVMKGRAVSKGGGEAVNGMGIRMPDGKVFGVATKILDGSQRAGPIATVALLERTGLITKKEISGLKNYRSTPILNHRKIRIGEIKARIQERG